MYLGFDIGNTDVVISSYVNNTWSTIQRIPSGMSSNIDFFIKELRILKEKNSIQTDSIDAILLSSVVPKLTRILPLEIEATFNMAPFVITPEIIDVEKLAIDNPHEIGSDLVANAAAANALFRENVVVVDFGTALTFTVVDKSGKIVGVAIAPGVKTSMKSLAVNTALLPEIPLTMPTSVLGKNTVAAMQAGIMCGYSGLVSGILKSIRKEIGECKVVATGGLANVMTPLHKQFDVIDTHLTLEGMRLIYESVRG